MPPPLGGGISASPGLPLPEPGLPGLPLTAINVALVDDQPLAKSIRMQLPPTGGPMANGRATA